MDDDDDDQTLDLSYWHITLPKIDFVLEKNKKVRINFVKGFAKIDFAKGCLFAKIDFAKGYPYV